MGPADPDPRHQRWLKHLHSLRHAQGLLLDYSVGFTMTDQVQNAILALSEYAWTPAVTAQGQRRVGADVAELTGMLKAHGLDLAGNGWPARLLGLGYDVQLVDPIPLHVERARVAGVDARTGDARALDAQDGGYDAVLLLGPLYHLVKRDQQVLALREATRTVRPEGLVIAAAISRYASLMDGYHRNLVDTPGFLALIRQDLDTGVHHNPRRHPGALHHRLFPPPGRVAERALRGRTGGRDRAAG